MMDGHQEDRLAPNGKDMPEERATLGGQESAKNEFRRRLLLGGAAAIPAILTVASARRSFAAPVLSVTCLERNNAGFLAMFQGAPTTRENIVQTLNLQEGSQELAALDNLIASSLATNGGCLLSNGIIIT
jgi:hypothetical protein